MTPAGPRLARASLCLALAWTAIMCGCRSGGPPVTAPPAPNLPAATPSPTPTPPAPRPESLPAPAARSTPAPFSAPAARPSSLPHLPDRDVRVLLAEAAEVVLPDPGRRYECSSPTGSAILRGPLVARQVSVRLGSQAGAFAAPENADRLARELRAHGLEASVVAASADLHRVIVLGRQGESAEALRARLAAAGVESAGRPVAAGGRLTLTGEGGATLSGPSVAIVPIDPDPVRFGERRFRGTFQIAPAAAGVRLVNLLPLETYLRGVVPAEMGPRAFPALEALKAQAVAARTYTIAHLGERAADGYDICATQACQVYDGVGVEHPLSDKAISETAGEILLWQGRPIDAMYHSTCAGHTEDAAAVLPDRAAPYLVGVRCRGESELRFGDGPAGPWSGPVERLGLVARQIGRRLGLADVTAQALATALTGRPAPAGVGGLVRAFGLDDAPDMLHGTSDASEEDRVLRLLATFRRPLGHRLGGQAESEWLLALALRLAQIAGHVEAIEGRVVPSPTGPRLIVDRGEGHRELSGEEVVLERRGDAWRRGAVVVTSGSSAVLWCLADRGCVALEVEPRAEADDLSAWGWWVRELTLEEIGARLRIAGASDLSVRGRGRSGRVTSVSVTGAKGPTELSGYRFRMALGLPDTLFVVTLRATPRGQLARFVGRGWGHGLGMCQNGAFGLAQGGADHEQILATYYTGAALATAAPTTGGVDE